jgi:hypothetical protein
MPKTYKPKHESLTSEILAVVDAFQAVRPLTNQTLSIYTVNDGGFIDRLRDNTGSFRVPQYDRIIGWCAANWPDGAKWPRKVARPTANLPTPDKRPPRRPRALTRGKANGVDRRSS